jgi:hypothetical protein
MATIQADDIADLVAGTLKDLGKPKFQQIAQQLQNYEVFPRWFKKDKVLLESGIGIQRNLMNRTQGNARHTGLYQTDITNVRDAIDQMSVPWRHAETSYAMDVREVMMNKGDSLIFNVIQPRRDGAMIDLVEMLEDYAWSSPAVTDKLLPYGLPYWIVKNATTGFNGGAPSGHTLVGNVSLTDSPTFKNYTALYTALTKADGIKAMRTAHRKIRFKSPIAGNDYSKPLADNYRIYCNETSILAFEDVGEAQNENLGRDVASVHGGDVKTSAAGGIMFRGHPICWIPKLDADTTNPIYMIDHSTFMPYVLKENFMRETVIKPSQEQHNTVRVYIDLSYQYLCIDRRRNAVLATSA